MITLQTYPLLAQNIKVEYEKTKNEFPAVREQLAIVQHGENNLPVSDYSKFSGVSTALRIQDGGNAKVATVKQGYRVTLTKRGIANLLEVTKQTRLYSNAQEKVMQMVREQSKSLERAMELDMSAHLYNAWSASYTDRNGETISVAGPDGLALMHSAHTCNGSTNTYNNQVGAIGTTHDPVSPAVLELLVEASNGLLNEADGKNFPAQPNTIITGLYSIAGFEVDRILSSIYYHGASTSDTNMATNVLKGTFSHLVVPYLDFDPTNEIRTASRANYCFLAKLGDMDTTGFRMVFSQDPMLAPQGVITESSVWQWMMDAYYAVGLTATNFIVGTKGDSTVVA